MAALTSVLALINLYVPFLSFFVVLVWTLPIVVVCVRHGVKPAIYTLIVSSIIIIMLSSPIVAITMILPCGIPALLLGMALQKQLSTPRTLFMISVGTLVSLLLSMTLFLFLSGANPIEQIIAIQDQTRETWPSMYEMGRSAGWIGASTSEEAFKAQMESTMMMLYQLVPAFAIIYSLSTTVISYLLTYKILTRLSIPLPVPLPFRLWRWTWWLVWGLIVGLACVLWGNHMEMPQVYYIGLNFLTAFQWFYVLNGLSVLIFYFHRIDNRFKRLYTVLAVVLTVMFWSGMVMVTFILGLIDSLQNIRKLPDIN